jgi:hypothetical protein
LKPTSAGEPARAPVAVALAALVALVGWLGWRSLDWPLVHDAPVMHYVAWRIADGAVPYRDLFDMNFPGVYLVHLAVVQALGPGDLAWRLADLAVLAAAALALAALVAPWGRRAAAGAALFFALYHLAGGAWQAGQRDILLCPLLLAGALGVARWAEARAGGRRRMTLACGGLALGASVTIKPHAAAFAAGLGVLVAVTAWRAGQGPAPVAWFLAGVAAVPAAVVVWLAAAGALPAWRAIVVDYLVPLYARLGRPAPWAVYRAHVWIPVATGAGLSLASAVAARRVGARHVVVTLGALYGLAHWLGQGKGWEYHLYPLAAFTAALLFAGVEPALARPRRPAAAALLACVVVAVALLGAKAVEASPAGWERAKAERARRLAEALAPRLGPGDTVQVFDTTAGGLHALLRLGVRQPTRFLYDFHFFHDPGHPTIRALRAELLRDLRARPPRLVVVWAEGWPAGGYERLDAFGELREWLARYALVRPGPDYRIYARPDGS